MGYCATGSGCLKLKSEVPEDVLALLSWENAGFSEVADSPDGGLWLTHEYEKYHNDDVVYAMNKIAPYVEYGDVEFSGEDDCHWRFHFEDGSVKEQDGEIVYQEPIVRVNVEYKYKEPQYGEGGSYGHKQFNLQSGTFAVMFNELNRLFNLFRELRGWNSEECWITHVSMEEE